MNALVSSVGWTLLHSVWEGTLLWLALRATLWLLRSSSARTRCSVSSGALALTLLVIGVTFVRVANATAEDPTAPSVEAVSPGLAGRELAGPSLASTPTVQRIAATALPYLVLLWSLGAFYQSTRLTIDWLGIRRLSRSRGRRSPLWLEARCRALATRLRISRPVRIVESAWIDGPMVIGWLKPVILIPCGALAGLNEAQIEGLLAHELAHVLRNDFAINFLQSCCEILFFYHPALAAMNAQIRLERENACDDIAVALSGDRRGYASALVQLEEARSAPLAMAAGGPTIIARIRRLVAPGSSARVEGGWWPAVPAVAVVLVLLLLAPGSSHFPYPIQVVPMSTSWSGFLPGDSITITSVRGTRPHLQVGGSYLVEGTYTLGSTPSANLGLSVTARYPWQGRSIVLKGSHLPISQGRGHFALWEPMRMEGQFHVSFYRGSSFGTVYFKEEHPSGS